MLAAALLLAAPAALAQAVTRPVVSVSAGVLRSSDFYDVEGNATDDAARTRSFAASLGAEAPVLRRGDLAVSAGALFALASYSVIIGDPDGPDFEPLDGALRPQRLDLFGRVGNAQISALLGASLNLGRDPYDFDYIEFDPEMPPDDIPTYGFNSDGQHAVIAQISGAYPLGPVRLVGQADAALTFANRISTPVFDNLDPDDPTPPIFAEIDVDGGDLFSGRLGVEVPVGPIAVGLAGFYASRTTGSFRYVDGVPPGFPPDVPAEQSEPFGYRSVAGLIPSVAFRTPDGRVAVRAEGAFSSFYTMEGAPVGITLSGKDGPVARPAVTLSASVGL